jgi:hypothetical protein
VEVEAMTAVAPKWAVVVAVVLPSVQAGKSQLAAVPTFLAAADI